MEKTFHLQQIHCGRADQTHGHRNCRTARKVSLSADKTSVTADGTDSVTFSVKVTKDDAPVSGAAISWVTSGGVLSSESTSTGSAGGSTVKLTSEEAGEFTVTATVGGVGVTSEKITFAPAGA
ncbi:Ig-like domain-containing protein [Enterobacter hormaechei]